MGSLLAGALSVEDSAFDSTERSFSFSGYAQHSGVKRKYQLSLNLYKEIDPAVRSSAGGRSGARDSTPLT